MRNSYEQEWRAWLNQTEQAPTPAQALWGQRQVLLRDLTPWLLLSAIVFIPSTLGLVLLRNR